MGLKLYSPTGGETCKNMFYFGEQAWYWFTKI